MNSDRERRNDVEQQRYNYEQTIPENSDDGYVLINKKLFSFIELLVIIGIVYYLSFIFLFI